MKRPIAPICVILVALICLVPAAIRAADLSQRETAPPIAIACASDSALACLAWAQGMCMDLQYATLWNGQCTAVCRANFVYSWIHKGKAIQSIVAPSCGA